jgi:hypothetical protein
LDFPSSDDVFYHLGKLDEKNVFSAFLESNASKTPGFEVLALIGAIGVAAVLLRRKK